MKREAAQVIAERTRETYDRVAREFSKSRSRFWEELIFLAEHVKDGDRVLDIGCGSGRFYPLVEDRHGRYTGIDYSGSLINEARRHHGRAEFLLGDATKLPFADNTFDIAYSFAVIHHIPGNELRRQFVREAARVLRPGGTFILSAWQLWNMRHVGRIFLTAFQSLSRLSPLDPGDVVLTFGKNKEPRYMHAFTSRGLAGLLRNEGFHIEGVDVIGRRSGERNIIVVAKKTA